MSSGPLACRKSIFDELQDALVSGQAGWEELLVAHGAEMRETGYLVTLLSQEKACERLLFSTMQVMSASSHCCEPLRHN